MTIGTIILDCAAFNESDAGTIDCLARLQLAARRSGVDLRLDNANECLLELIGFCGLGEVLRVEPERQAE